MSATTTSSPNNYQTRRIDLIFRLGKGSFGTDGFDTVSLTGLRCMADIILAGEGSFGSLNLRVFGIKLATMNKLTILNKLLIDGRANEVAVSAGSGTAPSALVFVGTIYQCWIDAQGAPDVSLTVQANVGLVERLVPAAPNSYTGPADVAAILSGIAQQMNIGFQNNGVSVILDHQYLPGSLLQQAEAVAAAAHINMSLDTPPDGPRILSIWPKNGTRGGLIPLISKDTGMIGYPTVTQNGLLVRTLFTPGIALGGNIKVQSEITAANGIWPVFNVIHNLESEMPGGAWFTEIGCGLLGPNNLPLPGS